MAASLWRECCRRHLPKLHVNLPSKQSSCHFFPAPLSPPWCKQHPFAWATAVFMCSPFKLHSARQQRPLQRVNQITAALMAATRQWLPMALTIKSQLLLWPPRASELWPQLCRPGSQHWAYQPASCSKSRLTLQCFLPGGLFLQTLTTVAHCHSGGAQT